MKIIKKILTSGLAVFFLMGLCACGKVTVQINDGGVVTELEVSSSKTVEQALEEGEIALNEGDEVSPASDTKVSEAQEIVISRKNTVSLSMDGKTREVEMVGGTVGDLLEQEKITLGEKQHVNYALDEYLTDGMEIKVSYSFSIEVQCDGKTYSQDMEAETVGDVLKELNITPGKDDRVTPAVTEVVTEGMKIVVNRVTFDTVVETEETEYETVYEDDSSMAKGQEEVSVKGENGQKEVTYKVTYVDGVEESREVVSETVTKEPINKVVKVGRKESSSSGGSGREIVSKKAFYDCDGSGHGYYEITYSDGSVEYEEF